MLAARRRAGLGAAGGRHGTRLGAARRPAEGSPALRAARGGYLRGPPPDAAAAALVSFETTRVSARFSAFNFSFSAFSFCNC